MNPDPGSLAYDAWYGSMGVNMTAEDPWHLLIRRELDLARDLTDKRILEIGCGRGGFACWLATRSPTPREIVAVDYSGVAVDSARAHAEAAGINKVTWQTGDIQAIDHADATFDTVFSCETIEHVPDPPKAVRELGRVLKPGGRLFLTTPNYLGPMGLYRAYLRLRGRRFTEIGQPINQFTFLPRTLSWILRAGLRPEIIRGEGHYLLAPGSEPRRLRWLDLELLKWLALHALIVARKPGNSRSP